MLTCYLLLRGLAEDLDPTQITISTAGPKVNLHSGNTNHIQKRAKSNLKNCSREFYTLPEHKIKISARYHIRNQKSQPPPFFCLPRTTAGGQTKNCISKTHRVKESEGKEGKIKEWSLPHEAPSLLKFHSSANMDINITRKGLKRQ